MLGVFKDKTVLVTGHTGFKGSWLSTWLVQLGANVVGLSHDIVGNPSNYEASMVGKFVQDFRIDIRNSEQVKSLILDIQPDFVFHLAAQALVRPSYKQPLLTMETNAMGTANILESLRWLDNDVVAVMITSDKAYDNVEWIWGYRETDRIGGRDPYSASKGMAELVIKSYVDSFFNTDYSNVRVGITRAGNVIGGGDWAVDRIVPDCMKASSVGDTVKIRSPNATRPWQHVLEPLSGYLCLAEDLYLNRKHHGEAYNFGPPPDQNHPVSGLIDEMSKYWDKVQWQDVSLDEAHVHEAGLLKLNCDKALFDLNWRPTLNFEDTVRMTVEWYREYYQSKNRLMHEFTVNQIEEYVNCARAKNICWTFK